MGALSIKDIAIILIICAWIVFAVVIMIRQRRKGKRLCGGDCGSCNFCKSTCELNKKINDGKCL